MNYIIEMSAKADRELFEAWRWYEDEQPGLGDRFEKEFFRRINFIQRNPLHYPLKQRYRETLTDSFPYLVVYRVFEKKNIILIVSVFHMKRHPKRKRR